MIDVKQAVEKSADYLRGIEFSAPQELRVEEVELSADEGCWVITLGFRGDPLMAGPDPKRHDGDPIGPVSLDAQLIAHPKYRREFRVFRVRKEDGEVESMKKRMFDDW